MLCDIVRRPGMRLVTLTGPGGVGKTRLALAVAEAVAANFADGVAFVALAPLVDPAQLAATVAQTLGVRESGDRAPAATLTGYLRAKRLLLVLDNFEHVAAAGTEVVELLRNCPELVVLVTSRASLRASGERVLSVPPLSIPDTAGRSPEDILGFEAVRLFVDRAQGVQSEFAVDATNVETVAAICRRLDGLPLALELAAARLSHLPLGALADRLERGLPLLTGGARDQPARHQTMRAAIAWSHDLLNPEEQVLVRRLAVFAGGCTLDAAEAVSGGPGVLDGLASLVDHSLLRQSEQPDGEPRFAMLETIREYGLERLAASGDEARTRHAHASYFLKLAEQADPALQGLDQIRWYARLGFDQDNLRAALRWAEANGEREIALRLAVSSWRFWITRGHLEKDFEILDRAFAAGGDERIAPELRGDALRYRARLAYRRANFPMAMALLQEAIEFCESRGNWIGVARAEYLMASLAETMGDDEAATTHYEAALKICRRIGDTPRIAELLESLADAAYRRDDLEQAAELAAEALAVSRTVGDASVLIPVLVGVAQIARAQGDLTRAGMLLREALERSEALGYRLALADTLAGCAAAAVAAGLAEPAARLLGAADTIREETGEPRVGHAAQQKQALAATRHQLTEEAFSAAWTAGCALTAADAIAEAITAIELAGTRSDGPPRSAASRTATSLTPREADVLRLLVEGHSDREIGDALFISHRTVMIHVANLLKKLGVESRTTAAAFAVRENLV